MFFVLIILSENQNLSEKTSVAPGFTNNTVTDGESDLCQDGSRDACRSTPVIPVALPL